MSTTTTTIANILKELYDDEITENQVNSNVLFTRWENKVADIVIKGKSFRINCPLRISRNQGIGARAEDTDLPAPKRVGYDNTTPTLASIYGSVRLTGHALDVSEGSNAAAFAYALDEEVNGMVLGMNLELGRYIHGDGSGALAQIAGAVVAATSFVVDNPDTRWLEVGMVIDVWTAKSGGAQEANSVEITNIVRATNTVTVDSAVTVSDNSWVIREDNHGVTQPPGLLAHVDDGTGTQVHQGIDRLAAGKGFWKANLVSNGGSAFSETFMQTMVDEAEQNGVDAKLTLGLCDHVTRRYIFKVLSAQKRFVNVQALPGGFSALTYEGGQNAIPIIADRLSWPLYLYFLDERMFRFGWAPRPGGTWMNRDGQMLHLDQGSGRRDAYIAYRYMRITLAIKNCRNQVRGYSYITP